MVPADQLAVADEEHFNPGLVGSLGHGDYVCISNWIGVDFYALLFGYTLNASNLVPQHRGALKFQSFGGLLHFF